MLYSIGRLAAGFAAVILAAQTAAAAELKVYSTIGVKSVLEELIPKFEKETDNKLNITWSTAVLLTKRVQAGEMTDAFVLVAGNLLKHGEVDIAI
jgi:molybdate transport system substrate-binding protein